MFQIGTTARITAKMDTVSEETAWEINRLTGHTGVYSGKAQVDKLSIADVFWPTVNCQLDIHQYRYCKVASKVLGQLYELTATLCQCWS